MTGCEAGREREERRITPLVPSPVSACQHTSVFADRTAVPEFLRVVTARRRGFPAIDKSAAVACTRRATHDAEIAGFPTAQNKKNRGRRCIGRILYRCYQTTVAVVVGVVDRERK